MTLGTWGYGAREMWLNATAITQRVLIQRRQANATPDAPLTFSTVRAYARVRSALRAAALARRRTAILRERWIQVRYPGADTSEDGPLVKWQQEWGSVLVPDPQLC